MSVTLFFFSRTPEQDYRYILPLPETASAPVRELIRSALMEMQRGECSGTLRFLPGNGDAVLLRCTDSGITDHFGRPIRCLEGFYYDSDIRLVLLSLPELLGGFFAAPSLYAQLVNGETVCPLSAEAVMEQCPIDKKHAVSLLRDILRLSEPVPLLYDAEGLHIPPTAAEFHRICWKPQEKREYDVFLRFAEKRASASLEAQTTTKPIVPLYCSEAIPREKYGWDTETLECAAQDVRCAADADGWKEIKR